METLYRTEPKSDTEFIFSDLKYERPHKEELEKQFSELMKKFDAAQNVDEQNKIIGKINTLRDNFETARSLVYIKHTVDTTDKFYETEQNYFDQALPVFEGLNH